MVNNRKVWYNILLAILLTCSPLSAQSQLSTEEALRLEVLQLKQQLKDARQEYVETQQRFTQCLVSSFQVGTGQFNDQLQRAYSEWIQLIEKNHPQETWDAPSQRLVPKVEKK